MSMVEQDLEELQEIGAVREPWEKVVISLWKNGYPLVNKQKAIENGHL